MKFDINEYFDKVYVLSLEKEAEKRAKIAARLIKYGINFDFFNAINGDSFSLEREWNLYKSRPLSTKLEIGYNKKFIESPGAWGALKSYIAIFKDALSHKYDKILIFEDDCLFCNDFINQFTHFIKAISEEWRIILLGASEYNLANKKIKDRYYNPKKLSTTGAFAVGYKRKVFHEILEEAQKMHTAFDNLPLGNIFEKYNRECFVAFPNLVIADVRKSDIRGERNLYEHSKRMNWPLKNFTVND